MTAQPTWRTGSEHSGCLLSDPDEATLCEAAVHLILCAGDAHEEHKVGDEEADAEVQVDGVACALDGSHEVKRDNADEEADQRQRQSHQCDHTQLVYILVKRENEESP